MRKSLSFVYYDQFVRLNVEGSPGRVLGTCHVYLNRELVRTTPSFRRAIEIFDKLCASIREKHDVRMKSHLAAIWKRDFLGRGRDLGLNESDYSRAEFKRLEKRYGKYQSKGSKKGSPLQSGSSEG